MPDIMTEAEIEALRALEAKAAPGPWRTVRNRNMTVNVIGPPDDDGWQSKVCLANGGNVGAAEFIAAARNAVPRLLATVEAMRAENERLRAALEFFASETNWRLGGPFDPNSPSFTGIGMASAALKGGNADA